jgi:hypothetical protein
MKSYLSVLALPALALAAAIDVRDTTAAAPLQIVSSAPLPNDPGNACPTTGDFGKYISVNKMNLTLQFDKFSAYIGTNTPDNQRVRTCNYLIIVEYPMKCTDATINITPRGTMHLADASYTALFHSENNFELTDPNNSDTQLRMTGKQYVATSDVEFKKDAHYKLQRNVKNDNEKRVKYTLRTTLTLDTAGKRDNTDYGLDSLDVSFSDVRSYNC